MNNKFLTIILTIALIFFFTRNAIFAQSVYGEISGTLTDTSGVPLRHARISVISEEKGTKFTTSTNQSGNFTVTDLLPDSYVVNVEADGFKTYQDEGVPVSADQTSRLDVKLAKGNASQVVSASGDVSILKTDRTDVSTIVASRTIGNLPVRDLNFTQFELLVPGALPTPIFLSAPQNPQKGKAIKINGQPFSGTALQLDGTDNRDPLEGLIVINPTLESVSEMKLTTQNYSAEFGEATAGVWTIQTRSGSNAWHGSGFDYRRTDWLQANDPFVPTGVAPTKRNEFGGSLAGPLFKNRLFFFGDYQGTRESDGFNQLLSVPTVQVRKTCFGPNVAGGPQNCNLGEYSTRIFNPNNNGQEFPRNLIPNSMISPAAVNLLSLLPAPNHGNPGDIVNNFLAPGAQSFNVDQADLRSDYTGRKFSLLARYSFADFRQEGLAAFLNTAGGVGPNPQGFAGIGRTRNQGWSSGFIYSFTPTLLTDFRFGFFRYRLNLDSPDLGTKPARDFALTAGLNNDIFSSGMPDIELPGLLPNQSFNPNTGTDYLRFGYSLQVNSCNCPLREREQQFQWVNNWTKTSGNHAFKWGADVRYLQNYRLASDKRRAGHLVFSASTTSDPQLKNPGGLALATFLLGDVSTLDRYYANPANPASLNAGERQRRSFFYGQDTWRVNSRLTLNYGLRWEIYFPQAVTGNGAGGFLIPNFSNPFLGSVFNVPGANGVNSQGNVKKSLANLGPRLGLAYLAAPKTVIRAGYGRSFDVGFAGSIFGISATQNPPVMTILTNLPPSGPSPTVNPIAFHLGQTAPAFIFPSFTEQFSINDLYAALTNPVNGSPGNQAVVYAIPSKMRLPTVDAWNLTFQHELTSTMYFEIGYVGNKGTHVLADGLDRNSYYDINQPSLENFVIPAPGGSCAKNSINTIGNGNFCISKTNSRQLFQPWKGEIRYFGNNASNNYNSLQVKVEKQFRQGYGFLAHYTWAKGLDFDRQYFNVNPRIGYGPSNFDRAHAFVLTNLWSLPLGRTKALLGGIGPRLDRIVGGWSLNAVTFWYSGMPFTPSYQSCAKDQLGSGAPCRPNLVGVARVIGQRADWFTTAGGVLPPGTFDSTTGLTSPGETRGPWQRPAPGTIGNVGRNSFRGPGFFQSDLTVAKDTSLTERLSVRFRADVINVFNKVNLDNPRGNGACVDCSGQGEIQELAPGAFQREFQFSVRFQF